jgi:hypothetical protein
MILKDLADSLISKCNTYALGMFCAIVLICGGLYMCMLDLTAHGSIDLKTTFVEGKIETGSLGLMAMFLGSVVSLVITIARSRAAPFHGQEMRITIDGNEIVAKELSYRKMKELLELARHANTRQIRDANDPLASAPSKRSGA